MHVTARAYAETLRRQLVSGELSATADHPSRTVSQVSLAATAAPPSPDPQTLVQQLRLDEFKKKRAELPAHAGRPSALNETGDAFSFSVLLSVSATDLRVATYSVAKLSLISAALMR